jgi:NADPH:quinone reductase-like Zn-dependent oxidoreductase
METVDLPGPAPAAGEVLLQVEAIGVGGVDAVIRRGTVSAPGAREGWVPGSEVAGIVTTVGAGVEKSWLGRRTWAFTGLSGGYAEQAVAKVENLAPIPDDLTSVDAVTLGSAGPVAHFALEHARFARGQHVLIRGAGGSIGIAAVELAARTGAETVTVTTSSSERGRRLISYGATHVLDREGARIDDFPAGPHFFDVIIDVVAGPALPAFAERLAPNGRLVLVGIVAGPPPPEFGMILLGRFTQSTSIATFSLDTIPRDQVARIRRTIFEDAARGDLSAVVERVLPLDGAAEAHRSMDTGDVFGRVVLQP